MHYTGPRYKLFIGGMVSDVAYRCTLSGIYYDIDHYGMTLTFCSKLDYDYAKLCKLIDFGKYIVWL